MKNEYIVHAGVKDVKCGYRKDRGQLARDRIARGEANTKTAGASGKARATGADRAVAINALAIVGPLAMPKGALGTAAMIGNNALLGLDVIEIHQNN